MINLELYRSFYMVAKTGSLTAAAKELFISQPALSQSVMALEQQLGGKLFVRTQKGMVLTPEGESMFGYVEQALHMFGSAENNFLQMKHLNAGSLRIGASDTLCRHFLLRYIKQFHELYPEVNIEVTNRTSPQTMALLRSGKVDVAFVNLPIGEHEFKEYKLMPLHDCFVGNETYAEIQKQTISEIFSRPLIMIEKASNTRSCFDKFMATQGIRVEPEIELGSFDLVIDFAKAGLGIGFVTKEFVQKEFEEGTLFEIKTDFELPERAIGGIKRKDMSLTFAASRFLEIVFDGLK